MLVIPVGENFSFPPKFAYFDFTCRIVYPLCFIHCFKIASFSNRLEGNYKLVQTLYKNSTCVYIGGGLTANVQHLDHTLYPTLNLQPRNGPRLHPTVNAARTVKQNEHTLRSYAIKEGVSRSKANTLRTNMCFIDNVSVTPFFSPT